MDIFLLFGKGLAAAAATGTLFFGSILHPDAPRPQAPGVHATTSPQQPRPATTTRPVRQDDVHRSATSTRPHPLPPQGRGTGTSTERHHATTTHLVSTTTRPTVSSTSLPFGGMRPWWRFW